MDGLIALLDADDLACFEAAPAGARPAAILALDLEVHALLRQRGRAHLTPFDSAAPDAEFAAFEADVQRFWSHHARLPFEGIDLLGLARFRHTACFTRLAWVTHVLRRTLERVRPVEIVTFQEPTGGHGLDQPPGAARMPLLSGVVRGLAEEAGVPVRLLRRPDAREPWTDLVAARAAPRLPPAAPPRWRRPLILFQANGDDLLRQLPVIERLVDGGATEVGQVYTAADDAIVRRLRDAPHHVWHESQLTADVATGDDHPDRDGALRAAWMDAARRAPQPMRCLFANRHLSPHFDFIFGDYARRLAWRVRAWRRLLRELRPSLLVVNHPAPALDIAAGAGVPTLALPHGLMVLGHASWFEPPPSTRVAAINPGHAERLRPHHDATLVRVTGDPGMEPLEARVQAARRARPALRRGLRSRLGRQPDTPVVALLTTCISSPAQAATAPTVDWPRALADLEAVAAMAARRPEWAFALRCHPRYDHRGLYARIGDRAGGVLHILDDEPLESLAAAADAIVVPNGISSVLVEASLAGTPVVVLDSAMTWWDHRRWGTDAWPRVNGVPALERWLGAAMSAARESAAAAARHAARSFLGPEGEAAASAAAWIEEIAAGARPRPGAASAPGVGGH
jgi:hypothetical protein